MLLEFKTKNYKSFKDEMIFSMIPTTQKGLDYSILKRKVGNKEHKALCSAVIYGPNASGKTNIIGAMETFKDVLLRGDIQNSPAQNLNVASSRLEFIPNCFSNEISPVEFSIKFIENGILFEYSLNIYLGQFMDKNYRNRKIISETLSINNKMIFTRGEDVKFVNLPSIEEYVAKDLNKNLDVAENFARDSLDRYELFLVNGFKSIFSFKLINIFMEWIEHKFRPIYRLDSTHFYIKIPEGNNSENNDPTRELYLDQTLNNAARMFGISSDGIAFKKDKDHITTGSLYSVIAEKTPIPIEVFESYGTYKFLKIFPVIEESLRRGTTLILDEFDASIHPMALMNIVNIFHNDEINKNNAQLIFNTHNPIFLNSSLYRRDEIKFVERDADTNNSTHYSLSDFKTSGKYGVRKNEDYLKNYFVNRYGAIKYIDFSSIFENDESQREVEP